MAFFALHLPDDVQQVVYEALSPLRDRLPAMQWVHREDYHLTLRFLGGLQKSQTQALIDRCEHEAPRVAGLHLALGALAIFARRHQHGILWLGLQSIPPELLLLQSKLEAFVCAAGLPADDRPFVPHITVARFSDKEAAAVDDALASGVCRFSARWSVGEYVLMQRDSQQSNNSSEALYKTLHVVSLIAT